METTKLTKAGLTGWDIECANCGGHGLVVDTHGEPDECAQCGGSGSNWQYPKGAIARYYGGPLIGRLAIQQMGGSE